LLLDMSYPDGEQRAAANKRVSSEPGGAERHCYTRIGSKLTNFCFNSNELTTLTLKSGISGLESEGAQEHSCSQRFEVRNHREPSTELNSGISDTKRCCNRMKNNIEHIGKYVDRSMRTLLREIGGESHVPDAHTRQQLAVASRCRLQEQEGN
jgi:hypothetical protein